MPEKMRIMVTGASGFLGPTLLRELAAAGHTGLAVSRRQMRDLPQGWAWAERAAVLAAPSAPGQKPVDAVVNLEVKQHVPNPTPADLAEFAEVNVEGVRSWTGWCEKAGVRQFVQVSTIKAVSDSAEIRREDASGLPSTDYGKSKRAGEDLAAAWAAQDSSRSVLVLRPAVIYGPGNTANIYSFLKAIDRNRFFLVGGSRNVKSLLSLRNAGASIAFLAARMRPGVSYFNLTDAQSHSVRELAEKLAALLGKQPRFSSLPLAAARLGAMVGDLFVSLTGRNFPLTSARLMALTETTHFSCEKLLEAGFRHPQTTEDGLREMVAWYRSQAPSGQP